MRNPLAIRLLLTAVVLTAALAGCSREEPTFVDAGATYDAEKALALPQSVGADELAEQPTSEAPGLRHEALLALRKTGGASAEAAALITRTFPSDSRGVPFYVERATFEDSEAWVIVEAIGRRDGKLTDERVWVLSTSGDVLLSGTR